MKKIVVLLGILLIITGCTNIKNEDYNSIIQRVVESRFNITNEYRTGYKYYIPNSMSSVDSKDYNEVLATSNYKYYLYVDVVSYYNRILNDYQIDNNAFFSTKITFEDKFGYLEVNKQQNNKYLVEIMYNYAKIEVMVEECDLKQAIANSIIILSSIEYNNEILESIIGDNVLEFNEETFNIFQTKKKESNYLDVEANDIYKEEDQTDDPDLVD